MSSVTVLVPHELISISTSGPTVKILVERKNAIMQLLIIRTLQYSRFMGFCKILSSFTIRRQNCRLQLRD